MLELQNIGFSLPRRKEPLSLLQDIHLKVTGGHFMAIVGPSGCGKTTLLKLIAGLHAETEGQILWQGRDLAVDGDLEPADLGYVPQFSIAYDHLTVEENIENAVRLRVRPKRASGVWEIVDEVLKKVGLEEIADRPVAILSGGQKRRLGLAMELVSDPALLLCDEVTSGLDPKSEAEIVQLLHQIAQEDHRVVISVTHSLANLDLYDSVLVLFQGRAAYHGPPDALLHYFSVETPEDVYPALSKREPDNWQRSWMRHRAPYYERMFPDGKASTAGQPEDPEEPSSGRRLPGFLRQFWVVLARRGRIFLRDRTQLLLHAAILIGFPILVTLFVDQAQDPIRKLSDSIPASAAEFQRDLAVNTSNVRTGGVISGLIMFQVVLLTLMGSNNSAREIVAERQIYEKERLGGLRPAAYLSSKIAFLSLLVLAQSLWMACYVQFFWSFPGEFLDHALLLVLVTGGMTAICLGISALMRSPEQASLLSVYLVGFQLPLSGAVLALPETIEKFAHPFISAYWSWSGSIQALNPGEYFAVKQAVPSGLSDFSLCAFVLGLHVLAGLLLAYVGCKKEQWN
ncbi:MAG: ATP-binding cassette domain-containing protein [Verrucomicrobiota bacterium]